MIEKDRQGQGLRIGNLPRAWDLRFTALNGKIVCFGFLGWGEVGWVGYCNGRNIARRTGFFYSSCFFISFFNTSYGSRWIIFHIAGILSLETRIFLGRRAGWRCSSIHLLLLLSFYPRPLFTSSPSRPPLQLALIPQASSHLCPSLPVPSVD